MTIPRRTDSTYQPVREASRELQRVTPAFKRAMDASPGWVKDAIRDYCSAIRAEAAAYRVEARTHRLRLEEITRTTTTPMDQDTQEDQA
ncbi:hypothetical protein [Microbacterium sp. CH1]|uniref:hypothetical protein n=1 Tax=Microbacterium sp. CH1 TaxID=1770208 RepID=UPI000789840D|nr:hypothetical protein [Microbacterium sp. CH1]KYJ97045.1 hypothetical protein AUV07_04740 [Microbacterium sp. CH1]